MCTLGTHKFYINQIQEKAEVPQQKQSNRIKEALAEVIIIIMCSYVHTMYIFNF